MPYLNNDAFEAIRKAVSDVAEHGLALDNHEALGKAADALNEALEGVATPLQLSTAMREHADDECEFDDVGAGASPSDEGCWVQAWVWVSNADMGIDDDGCATCAASTETRLLPCDECGAQDGEDD